MQWSDKTILIVEDDEPSKVYFERVVQNTGANVITISNGVEAFAECIKNPNISAVILDIMLPKLNGLETCRLIKKYRPDIAIIVESSIIFEREKRISYKYGCDDYLVKPVLPQTLKSTLEKHLFKQTFASYK